MKKIIIYSFFFLIAFNLSSQNNPPELAGIWLGKLSVIPGLDLRIAFHISITNDELTSTMDSPDQGVNGIPVTLTTYDSAAREIVFNLSNIKIIYTGIFDSQLQKINGTFTQGTQSFALNLNKTDTVTGPNRPQNPTPPFPYKQDDIVFKNGGIELAGTFTYPEGAGSFPAVILVTGSGPQDRDETIFTHKPFWIIADYLSRNGIAVLRYDDRGIGKSTGDFSTATSVDFAGDALAAVEFLKTRAEVDKNKIGIIGHSEGGLIAPMVANKSKDVSFIILLAGPGLPGDEIMKMQNNLIYKSGGVPDTTLNKFNALQTEMFNTIKNNYSDDTLYEKLNKILTTQLKNFTAEEKQMFGFDDATDTQIKDLISPWMKYFISYDPRPALQKISIPVLALNGSKDMQVPPKEDLAEIDKALKAAGNTNYEIMELEGLNHLFQNAKTGSPTEYFQIEETFSADALKIIGDWILNLK